MAARPESSTIRIGHGFDVHPWSDDDARPLVLGGVRFPDGRGLRGHSDADVIAHACTDALLGAAGLGDIGLLFPDTKPELAGADSLSMLAEAAKLVHQAGWVPANVDCTIVTDEPRIGPVREQMEKNLSTAVGAPVRVKGKRTEGLASLAEGIQCYAVALLTRASDEEEAVEEP